jgi:hypothetical protein
MPEAVHEQPAVREAGEGVVERQVVQALLGPLLLG